MVDSEIGDKSGDQQQRGDQYLGYPNVPEQSQSILRRIRVIRALQYLMNILSWKLFPGVVKVQ